MKTNLDYIRLDQDELALQPNGFLNIPAMITRTGVFTYYEESTAPDGTSTFKIIRQLRHPDEVFNEQSMETLLGLPLTNNHPSEREVSPENASDLICGFTTDRPKRIYAPAQGDQHDYIQQLVTFFDADVIQMIRNKEKTEMSLGYSCFLDEEKGEWNGVPYDYVQREIRYNHLSLVDRARGGPACRVLVDSEEKQKTSERIVLCDGLFIRNEKNKTEEKPMKTVLIDGKEFKVEDAVADQLAANETKLGESKKLNDAKQKEIDKLEAANDELKTKVVDQQEKKQNDAFNAAVKARVDLVSKATKILPKDTNYDSLSDREIKEKVIKSLRKDSNCDGKSDDYVDARFDLLVEDYKPKDESKKTVDMEDPDRSSVQARMDAYKRDQMMWKQDVGIGMRSDKRRRMDEMYMKKERV